MIEVDQVPSQLPDECTPCPLGARPPGPSALRLLPTILRSRRDSLAVFSECWRRSGDLVRLPSLGHQENYLVVHPRHVRHVLQDHPRRYEKTPMYRKVERAIGTSLLTTEGDGWLWRRRLLQPELRHAQLAATWPVLSEVADQLIERWTAFARAGEAIDLLNEMMRLTLMMAARAFFSADLGDELDPMRRAVMNITPHTTRRMQGLPDVPDWVPLPSHRRFLDAVARVDALVRRLVAERQASAAWPDDLLTLLLRAEDPTRGEPLTDRQLRDEMVNILLTGHETTAVGLLWVWYLLAWHPEQESRLQGELGALLGGRLPTVDDLASLEYTRMVVQEALRLYPPVWSFSRRPVVDDELGGYHIPAGSTLFLTPYLTHRHPDFWAQPERFDPERFAPQQAPSEARYAYFPFGAGPRVCVGSTFALGLSVLIVAAVAQHVRVRRAGAAPWSPRPLILLWPRQRPWMRLELT